MRSAMRLSAILAMLLASPLLAEDPPLAEILQDGNVAAKKQSLAGLIPGPADEKQRPVIREALKDKDRGVRQAAAVALAWAGDNDPAVIDELIKGMAEPWIPRYFSLPDDPLTAGKARSRFARRRCLPRSQSWKIRSILPAPRQSGC